MFSFFIITFAYNLVAPFLSSWCMLMPIISLYLTGTANLPVVSATPHLFLSFTATASLLYGITSSYLRGIICLFFSRSY